MLVFRPRQQTGAAPIFQPIAFTTNVDGCGVVQQAIENRGRDDRVSIV